VLNDGWEDGRSRGRNAACCDDYLMNANMFTLNNKNQGAGAEMNKR